MATDAKAEAELADRFRIEVSEQLPALIIGPDRVLRLGEGVTCEQAAERFVEYANRLLSAQPPAADSELAGMSVRKLLGLLEEYFPDAESANAVEDKVVAELERYRPPGPRAVPADVHAAAESVIGYADTVLAEHATPLLESAAVAVKWILSQPAGSAVVETPPKCQYCNGSGRVEVKDYGQNSMSVMSWPCECTVAKPTPPAPGQRADDSPPAVE